MHTRRLATLSAITLFTLSGLAFPLQASASTPPPEPPQEELFKEDLMPRPPEFHILPLYTPQYHLNYLNTDVDGYAEYTDAQQALDTYAEKFPDDIDYISDLCELPDLNLDNAGEYSDCSDRYITVHNNISDQHWRISDHVAYLASTKENNDLKKRVDAFNSYPSEENFLAIIDNDIPASPNNDVLFGRNDSPNLFERTDFPEKIHQRRRIILPFLVIGTIVKTTIDQVLPLFLSNYRPNATIPSPSLPHL